MNLISRRLRELGRIPEVVWWVIAPNDPLPPGFWFRIAERSSTLTTDPALSQAGKGEAPAVEPTPSALTGEHPIAVAGPEHPDPVDAIL